MEKQLWHKGEHIARIEGDLRNVYSEKDQLRRENERLNSVVSAEKGGQGVDVAERIAKEVDEAKTQYEAKMKELQEQKGKMDWRVGEVTNLWNDAKWRFVESLLISCTCIFAMISFPRGKLFVGSWSVPCSRVLEAYGRTLDPFRIGRVVRYSRKILAKCGLKPLNLQQLKR